MILRGEGLEEEGFTANGHPIVVVSNDCKCGCYVGSV